MKVVTFGEIMLRLGAPDYLRLNQCNQFDISFAGAEANVAVSLANYGVKAEYITRLPKHPIADKCISELLSYRVDVSRVIRGGKAYWYPLSRNGFEYALFMRVLRSRRLLICYHRRA